MDTSKDIMYAINNGKVSKYSPYRWLYYVYLPSIRRWKVGVAKSISNRMNSLGLQSLEGRDRIYEGTDYVVLFKRRYLANTAFKYERAIHSQSDLYRIPSTEKPLQSGNTELYWLDIGDTFIPYIPESDIPIKVKVVKVKKEPVKKVANKTTYVDGTSKDRSYKGLGYYYYPKTKVFMVKLYKDGKGKQVGSFPNEQDAIEQVAKLLTEGWTISRNSK